MGQKEARLEKTRVVFLDFLRIIACFLVIVNHTNSRVFLGTTPSFLWFLSLSYFFICKVAVPVFVIITGYTMLDRETSYRKTALQFLRVALCLVLFSAVYYISNYKSGIIENASLGDFLQTIIGKHITNAFWYLYLYLGIVLMIPFIQKMVVNMHKKDFHVFFVISGVFYAVWPIVVHYIPELQLSGNFTLPVYNSYICLLLFGCYARRYFKVFTAGKWISMLGFVAMCVLNVLLTYHEYLQKDGSSYLFFDNRVYFPIIAASCCLFYFASTIKFSEKYKGWIIAIAELTFGVYLISDLLISKFSFMYTTLLSFKIYPMIAMVIFELEIFVLGAAIAYLLKQIPYLKRIL